MLRNDIGIIIFELIEAGFQVMIIILDTSTSSENSEKIVKKNRNRKLIGLTDLYNFFISKLARTIFKTKYYFVGLLIVHGIVAIQCQDGH